jgi:hypothetical protein
LNFNFFIDWNMKFESLSFVCCRRSDGAQPHLVNIQFQKKVKLQVCNFCWNFLFFI